MASQPTTCTSEVDVIVVGAGVAGLTTATELASKHGVTSLAILEARNATGGRVQSTAFGLGGRVELGANWIHGVPKHLKPLNETERTSSGNPIWHLARKAGLVSNRIAGSCANVSGYSMYADGHAVSNASARGRHGLAAFDCINQTALRIRQSSQPDQSVEEALHGCGWKSHDLLDSAVEWELTSANNILSPANLSLLWMLPDPTYQQFGPDDFFVYDQRERGYATIADELVAKGKLESALQLGCEVISVRAREDGGVAARCADGRHVCGKHAVSTMPLGVMQYRQADIFQAPALPRTQTKALEAFTMGNFTKLFAQWKTPFWSDRGTQWLATTKHSPEGPVEFHDLGKYIPGYNTLFTYVVGHQSKVWEAMSDEDAAAALTDRLRSEFGMELPSPTAFMMTRHGSDPLMRGAYSTVRPGVKMQQLESMSAPLSHPRTDEDIVFFAGEHTCAAFQGFLHGAYLSGVVAAAKLARVLGLQTFQNDDVRVCDLGLGNQPQA